MLIKQNKYPPIEINGTEKEIVTIWFDENKCNVVVVERENLQALIDALIAEKNKLPKSSAKGYDLPHAPVTVID